MGTNLNIIGIEHDSKKLRKARKRLDEAGLSATEIDSYGNSLRRLTERIIGGENNVISAQLVSIEAMVKHNATLTADDSVGGYGLLATAKALLLDCRRDGTLPFSILAVKAFLLVQCRNDKYPPGRYYQLCCA